MPVGILQLAADVMLYFIWSAFSGVRIYALTGGSWSLSIAVCALAAVPACLNLYNDAKTSFLLLPLPFVETMISTVCLTCRLFWLDLTIDAGAVTIAARTCLIAADLTVLVVTWVKTYWTMKAARSSGSKAPLATMLLRDGTLYFLWVNFWCQDPQLCFVFDNIFPNSVLLILKVLHIAGVATNVFVYTTMFTTPISSIIVSHFLMNLREVASAPTTNGVQSTVPSFVRTQVSELRFASFVGNMGAPLDHSADTDSLEFGWEGESLETEVGSTEHEHGQWEKDVEMGQAGTEEGKGSGLEVLECQREGEGEALSH
ncbi:hypothetical protein CERSUDRAFT_97193 [Gelatoporia subvermispora B]|uniref:Uncharacterized protein n=1 Tax=Ceriporiopsis subvermispora (strain B) TaxID=914234 RepID=M2R843_CERS8|nr:hypothetical protein CERSUDRAFT_97193 [Gelatoporia subvermispora B]